MLLLDVPITSEAELAFVDALAAAAPDTLATVPPEKKPVTLRLVTALLGLGQILLSAWRLLAIRSKLPCITFSPKFSEAAGETSVNYCASGSWLTSG
jgi:hypothetical protein